MVCHELGFSCIPATWTEFLFNTLELVLHVEFNSKKKVVLKQNVSVLASLFCEFFEM